MIIDFLVLACTFFVSCLLLSAPLNGDAFFCMLVYATVILVSVRLGRFLLSPAFFSVDSVARIMLCNASGVLVGVVVMLALGSLAPSLQEMALVVVFASVMAFFVFGTISPLLKKNTYISKSRHTVS
ncbi:MAG: hypothetical protein GY784_15730 [Gammaproteobacteria bacterium]|nr:hypothetical protein [Gammaproteobacteria bacterium]